MVLFPNAKINLGLRILKKRSDGFHDVESLLYPVELSDALEIIPLRDGKFHFGSDGIPIPGNPSGNLCVKAYNLMSTEFQLPPVSIFLLKAIPAGAGLGGGSSDAAFTIRMLNELFSLKLSQEKMIDLARQLGSDCAFFIRNEPAFASGKGDLLEPADRLLTKYRIEIVTPDIHSNTAEAYKLLDESGDRISNPYSLKEIISKPVEEWKDLLVNDFEIPLFTKHPELAKIKQELYENGALYASMSGSGSAFYGIFRL